MVKTRTASQIGGWEIVFSSHYNRAMCVHRRAILSIVLCFSYKQEWKSCHIQQTQPVVEHKQELARSSSLYVCFRVLLPVPALSRLPARRLVQGRKRPMAPLSVASGGAAGGDSDQVVPSSSPLRLLPLLHLLLLPLPPQPTARTRRPYPSQVKRPPDA